LFYDFTEYFFKVNGEEILDWIIKSPKKMEVRIMKSGAIS